MLPLLLALSLAAAPPPAARGVEPVNGVRLAWARWGSAGPPLVLLHGGAGNGDHWASQLPALAERFTVYTVDARGHGRSTRDQKPMSYALMADDLLALLDALKLEQVFLVGWSDGGIVALDLAARHPERVTRLVLFGVNVDPSGTQNGGASAAATAYWARCAQDYAALSPTPKDWKGLLAALRPMWKSQPNFTDAQLRAVKTPTLVLLAEQDELIRGDHVKRFAGLLPNATLVALPGAGHFALFQQPEAITAAVLKFLSAPP